MPVAEKLAMKQKDEVQKTSSSSDLRQRLQRLRQEKEQKIQDSEVLNQNKSSVNTGKIMVTLS